MSTATAERPPLRIAFGAGEAAIFDAGLPVLAGEAVEDLFHDAQPAGRIGTLRLFRACDWLLGAATVPVTAGLEQATRRLYENIFQAAHGRHIARCWNYVPAINEPGPGGLENYRVFCRGRSLAFEEHYGTAFKTLLPSGSAVGSKSAALTIAFAACSAVPRHVENPLQVPAYEYPDDYGPRAPSFARATVVTSTAAGAATVFVSGTAAIRGHATVAPHDARRQLECALENLAEISAACGLGRSLDREGESARHFKVYVRHPADRAMIGERLGEVFLRRGDRVSYLQADICRASLLVEIEVTLFDVAAQR